MATATNTATTSDSQYTNWAHRNAFDFDGRIYHTEIKNSKYDDRQYVQVTVITHFENDDPGVLIVFNDYDRILSMYNDNKLIIGRQVSVNGVITKAANAYKKGDRMVELKRLQFGLRQARIRLGAYNKKKAQADA